MKNGKKLITALMITAVVFAAAVPASVSAAGSDTVMGSAGGWDEETGYFKNAKAYNQVWSENDISVYSEAKHTGKRERNDDKPTTRFRAHGWTTWVGVYHYTRARMEEHPLFGDDIILTDSGRVWGSDGTEAISPWWSFDPAVSDKARTYYGR